MPLRSSALCFVIDERSSDWQSADDRRSRTAALTQQSANLLDGVIDLDLKHWIIRLQFPAGGVSSIDRVKFRFEMAVDNRRESFGRRPVGSNYFLRFWFVN